MTDANIAELIDKNFFLTPGQRSALSQVTDPQALEKILPLLQEMDTLQTDIFVKLVEKNPNFFKDLDREISHEELMDLMQKEAKDHAKEIADAEEKLESLLAQL